MTLHDDTHCKFLPLELGLNLAQNGGDAISMTRISEFCFIPKIVFIRLNFMSTLSLLRNILESVFFDVPRDVHYLLYIDLE